MVASGDVQFSVCELPLAKLYVYESCGKSTEPFTPKIVSIHAGMCLPPHVSGGCGCACNPPAAVHDALNVPPSRQLGAVPAW